jgi:protein tyrosine/serine phosphatase
MDRHIRLEAVENFRDSGDYPTQAGRRLKRGRLYRSASHGRATEADLAAIEALELAVIVDLRRPGERERDRSSAATSTCSRAISRPWPKPMARC